jgi:hypothetical protein
MTLLTAGSRQTNTVRQPRTDKAWRQNPEGAEVPEAAAGRQATTYHILRERDSAGVKTYEPVAANVAAANADDAIRRSVTDAGNYVAIPSRSFKPVAVTVETKTTLKLT